MLMIDEHDARTLVEHDCGLQQFEYVQAYNLSDDGGEFRIVGAVAIAELPASDESRASEVAEDGFANCRETYRISGPRAESQEASLLSREFSREPFITA